MSTVSAGVPVILLFLTRSFKEFEKKSCSSKTFGFFSNKLSLERGISSEQQLGKNIFHLRGQRLLSLIE
ncbi:hypothetical protein pdam_00015163, partial [Pocillopora damicornis]